MLLKVCGLNNIDNIRQLLPLQPHVIGFVFHPASGRFAGGSDALARYAASVTGVQKAGVFVDATEGEVANYITSFALDLVQLHGGQSAGFCEKIRKLKPVIKVFSVDDDFDALQIRDFMDVCDYFLFDTATPQHGGSGIAFNRNVLRDATIEKPFFLSGGISPGNIGDFVRFKHPFFAGIDINSRYETSPGVKNIELIKQSLHEIRS